jgi:LacI family transcriptional regulator, xylobiose transport system transcriptional regulator
LGFERPPDGWCRYVIGTWPTWRGIDTGSLPPGTTSPARIAATTSGPSSPGTQASLSGPEHILCSRARLDGYRAAMDAAGVPVDPNLLRWGDFHVEDGIGGGRALLALRDRPTAIFAGNDLQAFGIYQAAREARLHIPEDLSVIGFDDLPVAKWVGPPLTTIRQPLAQMAATAARMVLELARGVQPAQSRLELATELVVRESTAPPRT